MKRQSGILAGTALGLLMASTTLSATPLFASEALPTRTDALVTSDARIILAQAQTEEEKEQQQTEEQQPAEEPAAQEEQQQAPAEAAPAQAESDQPAADEAPAEQQAAPDADAEQDPAQAETDQPADEAAPADEATTDEPATQDTAEPTTEEAPAEQQAAPDADAEQDPAQAETDQPADDAAPADEATTDEPATQDTAEPTTEEAPAEQQAAPDADAEQDPAQAETDQPADEAAPADEATTDEPATQDTAEEPATGETPAEQQAAPETDQDQAPTQAESDQPNTGEEAPILDSAKEAETAPAGAEGAAQEGQAAGEQQQRRAAPAQAATPPETDAEAQANIQVEEIQPVTAEEGERLDIANTREARREARRERRERRENAEVLREFDDNRTIVEIDNHIYIESPDYERIILDDDEVYYEALPRGRTREVILRPDGSRVVTVRNRYGDIVRRSRILPDDREVVLVYVEDRYYDEVLALRDPGASLPPLQLTIPRDEYILEAEEVSDPDVYYTFLDQPPVDTLERTYSVEEVKRSARIRDTVRRVDLDTINFEFGSAEITESEIDELEAVATAIQRLLEENPAETFLIEGHTDAVGSELANLALSDRRAEAVATALSGSFDIPPENLVTQGYGEQYLKVETQEPARENRRVAMRRITPLVKPVASAE